MQQTFPFVGYYAVDVTPGLRLLALDSVLFSNKVRGQALRYAAERELNWLHQQLLLARQQQQRVLIAMHIPPGKDLYLFSSIKLFRMLDLWQVQYEKRFNSELSEFAPQIAGILTGHLHMDSLHTLLKRDVKINAISVPALSPIFGTQPAFSVLFYSSPNYQFTDRELFTIH